MRVCNSIYVPVFLLFLHLTPCRGSDWGIEGRYSFSLTTFSPDGKLSQVEYASRAASLGPPVAAVLLSGGRGVALSAPHSVPTPLVRDDGTARFCAVSGGWGGRGGRGIIVGAHSGVGADGRAALAAAQRLAVEHAYTFEEDMPIETFLEEVSLLFQRYTMKPGSRPFGCSLLVAYCGSHEEGDDAALYRIDPSGSVETLGDVGCIGGGDHARIARTLEEKGCARAENAEEASQMIAAILEDVLRPPAKVQAKDSKNSAKLSFLVATMTPRNGLVVRRSSD
mmetsp:Transcript_52924/g.158432  ORF Transcript_52924/g.158432 Transcript_52924/m.158432 type:complete len:281 (-) Transcript_52924:639-1481(-)|eukprot:CAMPEP_0113547324 /NCGR_PEP_ID=MMETSP0015_2-20120614/12292_1 /TAXON_ID=2838 /ORGANISM="Odontella" /LENGTH=280 /DNA_ID=CAMNT_0000447865 /DNA_START=158 /DNA_END=1000 /DNA_ORIENTATION=- /assembly_acc=CAM_ASM_000160